MRRFRSEAPFVNPGNKVIDGLSFRSPFVLLHAIGGSFTQDAIIYPNWSAWKSKLGHYRAVFRFLDCEKGKSHEIGACYPSTNEGGILAMVRGPSEHETGSL